MADLFVMGDTDTVLGFAYVGVPGTVVETAVQAKQVFDEIVKKQEVQILVITEGVARFIQAEVDHERFDGDQPVVVEIPGPEGPRSDRRSLIELIRLAIGVRI